MENCGQMAPPGGKKPPPSPQGPRGEHLPAPLHQTQPHHHYRLSNFANAFSSLTPTLHPVTCSLGRPNFSETEKLQDREALRGRSSELDAALSTPISAVAGSVPLPQCTCQLVVLGCVPGFDLLALPSPYSGAGGPGSEPWLFR